MTGPGPAGRMALLLGLAGGLAAAAGAGTVLRLALLAPSAAGGDRLAKELEGLLAGAAGADLAVLPALVAHGPGLGACRLLAPGSKGPEAEAAKALLAGTLPWAKLRALARTAGLPLIAGALVAEGDGLKVRALAYDPRSGMERGADQTHFQPGGVPFMPGSMLAPLGHPFPGIGVLLREDSQVPEAAATLVVQGAEILLALSPPAAGRTSNLPALARVFGCFVAAVDRADQGRTQVFNPWGDPVEPDTTGPGLAIYRLPVGRSGKVHRHRPPRRPELYRDLVEPFGTPKATAGDRPPHPAAGNILPSPDAAKPEPVDDLESFDADGFDDTSPPSQGASPAHPVPAGTLQRPPAPGTGRSPDLDGDGDPDSGTGTTGLKD